MVITISGLSGSGKSTVADLLAARLGIPAVDVGNLFRAQARKAHMSVAQYGKYAATHPEIDRKLDGTILRRARRGSDIILQGRLTGALTHQAEIPAVRIWLGAPLQTRASRVAGRENIPYTQALTALSGRDRVDQDRYKRIYGLDLNDLSIYDIVVRTESLSIEQVISALLKKIPHVWRTKKKIRQKSRAQEPRKSRLQRNRKKRLRRT